MNRHDRVRVDFSSRTWPNCVVFPHGCTGTVLEVMAGKALVQLDSGRNEWVNVQYLKGVDHERSYAVSD